MKTRYFTIASLLLALFFATGCNSTKPSDNNTQAETKTEETSQMDECEDVPGTFDFNGDGKKESFNLLEPKMIEEAMDCEGDCNCQIVFSDSNIPPIEVPDCIGGTPENLGDLDGNGTCEIGIWPSWWTSCWHTYYIYTFVNGRWSFFVEPFSVHCNLMEELEASGESIIEPVPGKKDMFEIKFSEFDIEEGILTKTAIVKKFLY